VHTTETQRIRTTTKFAGPSGGHSENTFCSSVTKVAELILLSTHGYLLLFTFPPSMLRCSMLEDLFLKKTGYVIQKICILAPIVEVSNFFVVYYESIKRELKIRSMYECRCDERLQTKTKEFKRLTYTGLVMELGHLKIETRLIDEKFANAMGEYVTER
jgi:hypothetical protein